MASVNYELASILVDPNASFGYSVDPTNYDDLKWLTTPITKSVLDTAYLASEKTKQINTLTLLMQAAVTGGFLSDALVTGTFRKYDSDIQGQLAVVGAMTYLTPGPGVTPPTSYTLPSVDPSTGIKEYSPYSYSQLFHLFNDLEAYSSGLISTLTDKITAVNSINTGDINADLDSVYAITWP